MVRKWTALLLLAFIGGTMILPLLIVSLLRPQPTPRIYTDRAIRLYLSSSGKVKSLPLEQYLEGVVAAEMPARFNMEALKAQAVAARSYAMRQIYLAGSGQEKHQGADVCDNSGHCQAWISDQEMQQRWGSLKYYLYRRKIAAAVSATKGLVLTYQGGLIEPLYHSNSGGVTEDAAEVWGKTVPYLQSVPSPWEKGSPHWEDTMTLSYSVAAKLLGVPLSQSGRFSLAVTARTGSGRVKTVVAAGRTISGTRFRQLLGLNSTLVSWEESANGFIFHTRGYGHGVGMPQYGANSLARQGKSFGAILGYYYSGAAVESVESISGSDRFKGGIYWQ